jgi:hypothetical protein
MSPAELLWLWASHIKDVYEQRGRCDAYSTADPREYVPLEVFHTCHGCGAGAIAFLHDGLCPRCHEALQSALKAPDPTARGWIEIMRREETES